MNTNPGALCKTHMPQETYQLWRNIVIFHMEEINHEYKTKENWLTYREKCIAVLCFGGEPQNWICKL